MDSTAGFKLRATAHATQQILAKGFQISRIQDVFDNPDKVYANKRFEGQYRVTGGGLCLVGKPVDGVFTLITVYEDGVMTPPRPEQLDTPEGRAYARLYNRGAKRQNEYRPRVNVRNSIGSDVDSRRGVR
jgi:hypothetical protein